MRESEPPPPPPKATTSYKYKLLTPKGTLLASCPTRSAALQSAAAMYGPLKLDRSRPEWMLYNQDGFLVAIVTGKK